MPHKTIAILGSTGSIGRNAVKVVEHLSDRFSVHGIAGYNSVQLLAEQAAKLSCALAVTGNTANETQLASLLPAHCQAASGESGLVQLATAPEVDLVLCAIVGTSGLLPVLEAIRAGKDIAIASKEILVMAGELVMAEAKKAGVKLLPVDSEHSAIFQCLEGKNDEDISRLILTASGGPFRTADRKTIENATFEDALAHPTWDMGPKVTIDSATLMNKALEVIEAKWLFGVGPEQIDVVIHPQSIVHSMVEFVDGTVLAQMSTPDMRFPIQYAITYPDKCPGSLAPLDFAKCGELSFSLPDRDRFPALDFAYESLRQGGTLPAVMNAANEVAVTRFRRNQVGFTDIWNIIEKVMSLHDILDQPSLDAILSADQWAREAAQRV